jgi:hypothetical protein
MFHAADRSNNFARTTKQRDSRSSTKRLLSTQFDKHDACPSWEIATNSAAAQKNISAVHPLACISNISHLGMGGSLFQGQIHHIVEFWTRSRLDTSRIQTQSHHCHELRNHLGWFAIARRRRQAKHNLFPHNTILLQRSYAARGLSRDREVAPHHKNTPSSQSRATFSCAPPPFPSARRITNGHLTRTRSPTSSLSAQHESGPHDSRLCVIALCAQPHSKEQVTSGEGRSVVKNMRFSGQNPLIRKARIDGGPIRLIAHGAAR